MEEWRELAKLVPRILLHVTIGMKTGRLLWILNSAYRKLVKLVYMSRRVLMGATRNEIDAIPEPPPDGYGPNVLIERARCELDGLRELHAGVGHVFVLYGTSLGLLQGDPLWQRWEGHSADALRHAAEALQGLRHAASRSLASTNAFRVILSFPPRSPDCDAWVSAALNLALRAIWGVTKATLALRRMLHAVALEFSDAYMVLNR